MIGEEEGTTRVVRFGGRSGGGENGRERSRKGREEDVFSGSRRSNVQVRRRRAVTKKKRAGKLLPEPRLNESILGR